MKTSDATQGPPGSEGRASGRGPLPTPDATQGPTGEGGRSGPECPRGVNRVEIGPGRERCTRSALINEPPQAGLCVT